MTSSLLPTSAAPGFHFGDLYAVALLAAGLALVPRGLYSAVSKLSVVAPNSMKPG